MLLLRLFCPLLIPHLSGEESSPDFFRTLIPLILVPSISTPADPCKNVKCNFGAECHDGRCICPSDCPADLIEPVCVHSKISYISECEMRASACKQEVDIDTGSFVYGHCPHTVTTTTTSTTPPDDKTEGSGDDFDDDDDDEDEAGAREAVLENRKQEKDSKKRGKDAGSRATGSHKHTDSDPDDSENDPEEDFSHPANSDFNEDDAFRSKLCRNMICPIGALCKLKKRQGAGAKDQGEVFCDCRHMCDRVEQMSLATAWIKSPVCGSNGVLYPNECRLRQDSCIKNKTLNILTDANCRLNASSSTSTSEENNNHPDDLHGKSFLRHNFTSHSHAG